MIKLFIALLIGFTLGILAVSISVASGDAERCAECMREREKNE